MNAEAPKPGDYVHRFLLEKIRQLKEENERYRDALEFYAWTVVLDKGERARKALGKSRGKQG